MLYATDSSIKPKEDTVTTTRAASALARYRALLVTYTRSHLIFSASQKVDVAVSLYRQGHRHEEAGAFGLGQLLMKPHPRGVNAGPTAPGLCGLPPKCLRLRKTPLEQCGHMCAGTTAVQAVL